MMRLVMLLAALCAAGNLFAAEGPFDFELYNLKDTLYAVKAIREKPATNYVAVDFFSIHCEPCKKALPEWNKLYTAYKDKGLEIIIVVLPVEDDRDAEYEKITAFFAQNPVPFPVVYDKYKLVGKKYSVINAKGSATVPLGFLLNKSGALIIKSEGHEALFKKIQDLSK